MWKIKRESENDKKTTLLLAPDGTEVLGAEISTFEEDANNFWVDEARLLKALNGVRLFPIQSHYVKRSDPPVVPYLHRIPWSVAELAYSTYSARYGRQQSLERLAERGGFGPSEMDEFNPGWRDQCSEIIQLRARVAELESQLNAARQVPTDDSDTGGGPAGILAVASVAEPGGDNLPVETDMA